VLHHRHQLDVREAGLDHVLGELLGQLDVGQARPPRAQVHLVRAHRLLVGPLLRPGGHPLAVLPLVHRLVHHRRGGRRHLGVLSQRVGVLDPVAVPAQDLELVLGADVRVRHVQLPDAGRAQRPHRPAVVRAPAGEVADHLDAVGARRPDREGHAGALGLRAQHRPELLVPALADQVQVELTQGGQMPVRVVELLAVHVQPVVQHGARQLDGDMPSGCTLTIGVFSPPATTLTSLAPLRSVRMTVFPPAGCVPGSRAGRACRPRRCCSSPADRRRTACSACSWCSARSWCAPRGSRYQPTSRAMDRNGIRSHPGRCRASYAAS